MYDLSFPKCLKYIPGCSFFIGPSEFIGPINGNCCKCYLAGFYRALSLLPIVGIVDVLELNVELSAQSFYQCLYPFYLEVGWKGGFTVSYNADADSLTAAVPGSAWYG